MPFLMLLAIPICGLLWAFAGADGTSKLWRRWGVGLTIAVLGYAINKLIGGEWQHYFWLALIVPCMFGATSCGYGVPSK